MRVKSIIPAVLVVGTTLLSGCKNTANKVAQPVKKQAEVLVRDTVQKKYADIAIYCGFEKQYNLRIENGISFITDNVEYSASNGNLYGKFLNQSGSIKSESSKFLIKDHRDYSLPVTETINMFANFTKENSSRDTLTLSKADIKDAKSRLKSGTIWKDAKDFFVRRSESYLRFGQVKNTKNPEGIKVNIYDGDYKLCDVNFNTDNI